jgi:hypothetical protein
MKKLLFTSYLSRKIPLLKSRVNDSLMSIMYRGMKYNPRKHKYNHCARVKKSKNLKSQISHTSNPHKQSDAPTLRPSHHPRSSFYLSTWLIAGSGCRAYLTLTTPGLVCSPSLPLSRSPSLPLSLSPSLPLSLSPSLPLSLSTSLPLSLSTSLPLSLSPSYLSTSYLSTGH